MASIILRNSSNCLSPAYGDAWRWSWDPLRTLGACLSAEHANERAQASDSEAAFTPRFDVKEGKGEYVLSADLPGVKPEAVEIALDRNRLKTSGRREAHTKEETDKTFFSEVSYGSFSRQFTLPEGVDGGQVHASLRDGVLTVIVPKKPESQPRTIPVTVAD
jgi:HSP20 family protein